MSVAIDLRHLGNKVVVACLSFHPRMQCDIDFESFRTDTTTESRDHFQVL
jgi:hypothetical protein